MYLWDLQISSAFYKWTVYRGWWRTWHWNKLYALSVFQWTLVECVWKDYWRETQKLTSTPNCKSISAAHEWTSTPTWTSTGKWMYKVLCSWSKLFSTCHINFCISQSISKVPCRDVCSLKHKQKRILWKALLSESRQDVPHLITSYENIESITRYFPKYFTGDDVNDETDEELPEDIGIINKKNDANFDEDLACNFDTEIGLWKYNTLSTHKLTQMDNDELIANNRERIQMVVEGNEPNPLYQMMLHCQNTDETPYTCDCGDEFNESGLIHVRTAKLFTHADILTL